MIQVLHSAVGNLIILGRISNKQFVQIHMKGTINYLWEGLNISKDCTFLDTFKASGSSLVESSYLDWPD